MKVPLYELNATDKKKLYQVSRVTERGFDQ